MVVLIEIRKALQRRPLIRQTLEDKWNFNKCRWREKIPSRGPALGKVSWHQG